MFNRLLQSVSISLESLWANKVRSFITMLGIIIGVSSVVLIMSIGAGAQHFIVSQVESLGSNLLTISPGGGGDDPMASFASFDVTTLTYDDYVYLRESRNVPNIESIAAYSRGFGAIKWRSESYDTALNGVTASYLVVEQSELLSGRFFTEEEEKNLSRVVVIGHAVKESLFGESDAVGQRIKIKEVSYEVIGILKERGSVGLEDYDDQALIPIRTVQRMNGISHIGVMRARVDDEKNIDLAVAGLERTLRDRHDVRDQSGEDDDFSVTSALATAGIVTALTDGIRYFLTAMASLSLVVGGIGIMNIMLISVTERTREIGLRKAIGANNAVILEQFLFEAVIVTGVGGLIGILIGASVSFLIALGVQFAGFDWSFVVPFESIVLAMAVSAGVGLLFGMYPAQKASKLDPIVALRHE